MRVDQISTSSKTVSLRLLSARRLQIRYGSVLFVGTVGSTGAQSQAKGGGLLLPLSAGCALLGGGSGTGAALLLLASAVAEAAVKEGCRRHMLLGSAAEPSTTQAPRKLVSSTSVGASSTQGRSRHAIPANRSELWHRHYVEAGQAGPGF